MNFTKVYVITYILDKNTSADKDISFPSIFIHIYIINVPYMLVKQI